MVHKLNYIFCRNCATVVKNALEHTVKIFSPKCSALEDGNLFKFICAQWMNIEPHLSITAI